MDRLVCIIGAGVGGLSAAVRLAASGCRVKVYESLPLVGGKLNHFSPAESKKDSDIRFRFDTGPSLLTIPHVAEQLFQAAGTKLSSFLALKKLDPIARFVWADGTRFELSADPNDRNEQVRRISPDDVQGWNRFMQRGEEIWNLSAEMFIEHAPEQLMKRGFKAGMQMLTVPFRIGMFSSMAKLVDKHVKHPKLREVLYQYATYSGASPFRAPSTLAVIPYAELHFGGWYPMGGMYELASALEKLARSLGVEIHTNCPVEKILVEKTDRKPKAAGIQLRDGTEVRSDYVVANSDAIYTYRDLIPSEYRRKFSDKKIDNLDPGGSGMVLLLGVDGTYPQLAHHTKFMPADYTSDLRAMFETQTIPDDPCLYVCATTRTDPSQAPAGCENLFVLCSAPNLKANLNWDNEGQTYRDRIIHTLEHRFGLTDLGRRIRVERRITPFDMRKIYNANFGSIYGIGSNSRLTAFRRPPNRDQEIRNLFLVGGATHPGGGLPLVMLSGKIVSELILAEVGS